MALYTASLTGGVAIGTAGTAVLISHGWGWRLALGSGLAPALLAGAALAGWLLRGEGDSGRSVPDPSSGGRVWRSVNAWQLAVYMGCQCLLFYSVLAWLPVLLQEDGVNYDHAAGALNLFNLLGFVGALITPPLAARGPDQRAVATITATAWVMGLAGMWWIPSWYIAWSALLGVAQGAGIAIALTLIVLRAADTETASALSGMVQMSGYFMASVGPLTIGWLRDLTGAWSWGFGVLVAVSIVTVGSAFAVGRDTTIRAGDTVQTQ